MSRLHELVVALPEVELREFVLAQYFEQGLAADVNGDAEESDERAIGQLNATIAVEQEQPFDHAVEQRLLLGIDFPRLLLEPILQRVEIKARPLFRQ